MARDARLFPRLSAASGPVGRDARRDAAVGNQRGVLPAPDAGHARSDFTGYFCQLPRTYARRLDEGRYTAALARISHSVEAHRGANQRKLLCSNDFSLIQGAPRCRQSVAQNDLILEWWKVGLWKRPLMAGW